jgi:hypothetical protein
MHIDNHVRNPGDPPVAQPPRRAWIGLDGVAQLDRYPAAATWPTMVAACKCSRHNAVSAAFHPPKPSSISTTLANST